MKININIIFTLIHSAFPELLTQITEQFTLANHQYGQIILNSIAQFTADRYTIGTYQIKLNLSNIGNESHGNETFNVLLFDNPSNSDYFCYIYRKLNQFSQCNHSEFKCSEKTRCDFETSQKIQWFYGNVSQQDYSFSPQILNQSGQTLFFCDCKASQIQVASQKLNIKELKTTAMVMVIDNTDLVNQSMNNQAVSLSLQYSVEVQPNDDTYLYFWLYLVLLLAILITLTSIMVNLNMTYNRLKEQSMQQNDDVRSVQSKGSKQK